MAGVSRRLFAPLPNDIESSEDIVIWVQSMLGMLGVGGHVIGPNRQYIYVPTVSAGWLELGTVDDVTYDLMTETQQHVYGSWTDASRALFVSAVAVSLPMLQ